MKTLKLTLKKQWFNMILSGEKKEEYREIKPYWAARFMMFPGEMYADEIDELCSDLNLQKETTEKILSCFGCKLVKFDAIRFTIGYSKNAPTFTIECNKIEIRKGKEDWGAERNKKYFVFNLGSLL